MYPKKILIIRFSSIGDIVLTSPVIRVLRQKFPKSVISMLVKEEFAPLAADCPYLNEIVTLKKDDSLISLAKRLKGNKFDVILDLHHNLRSLYLDFTLSPKKSLIYDKRVLKRWVLLNFKLNLFRQKTSVVEYYFETLKSLGINDDDKRLELWVNKTDEEKAVEFLNKNIEDKKCLIGLSPFAHWETKCWPLSYYLELMKNINKKMDCQFVIFGGPGEDKKLGNIFNELKIKPLIAIGWLSLMAQAALIKKCDYFIGNDTGLMHIADAADIPLIAFFGPTVPEFGFAPSGKNAVILSRNLKCRPCSLHGSHSCPKGTLECLVSITPEEVSSKVMKYILKNGLTNNI
ncbi:MAG: glycosyltransferase family 9 protein [bacterium]